MAIELLLQSEALEDSPVTTFCEIYRLGNPIKKPRCFKNPENPTCVDSLLKNNPFSFKNTYVIEAGLYVFHKIIVAVMKMHFPKI